MISLDDVCHRLFKSGDNSAVLYQLLTSISENVAQPPHWVHQMLMRCNWEVAVENTLEDLHVPFVHRHSFHKLRLKRLGMQRHGKHSIAFYQVGDERIVKGLQSMSRWFVHVDPTVYFHLLIYPNVCLSSVGGFSYSLQHYEGSKDGTWFSTQLFPGKLAARAPDLRSFFDEAARFNRQVFEEDAEICANVQGRGGVLMPQEQRIAWFREERDKELA